jgi:hypothetical protein
LHAFTCTGDAPGKLLGVTTPGTAHEMFFTTVGDPVPDGTVEFPVPDGPPDLAAILEAATQAGMTVLAPQEATA